MGELERQQERDWTTSSPEGHTLQARRDKIQQRDPQIKDVSSP